MATITVTASLTLAAVPAQAASVIPAPPQTCSSGQPKLDYESLDYSYHYVWSNVCGIGTWLWNTSSYFVYAIRMPTSPYHRIWFHQNPDGSGLNFCFYSTGNDIYVTDATPMGWIDTPGNIQVSANTSPC
jgi:hypothetical protein